ncbi:MAG: hypothetical protein AAF970_05045 [Bacteroidota bacterium]
MVRIGLPALLFLATVLVGCGSEAELERYYQLPALAKAAVSEDLDQAQRMAEELLQLADQHDRDWNYGNALHDGHMVLGQVALRRGDAQAAAAFLLRAGETPGSPQLNSFGPNMRLAQDLLKAGQPDVVVTYFDLCDEFWEMGADRLARWSAQVRAGDMPSFGANLLY